MERGTTIGNQRIASLFDSGTFVEIGSFMRRSEEEMAGAVCGYGAIDGKLAYAFVQDSDRKKGAFDALQAKKIDMLYKMAMKNGAPVIGVFDSVGAVVSDGANALAAYGTVLKAVSDASGVIPQIAVIAGTCTGMAATVASMFDLTVTVKEKSCLTVNAPFLIGKDAGSAEATAQSGLASVVAESEEEAMETAARLVAMLPSNNAEGVIADEPMDDVNRTVSVEGMDAKALADTISDASNWIELGADHAPEMLTGLMVLGGVTCGLVANNATCNGGVITAEGAKKAAKLVGFCDSLSIPVVTLVNSRGVEISREAEDAALAAQLGKLAMAYACAETAKITVIVGKAYGAAFALMGSKALGADMVYALQGSEISVMDPASAVAFLWNDRITEEKTRADLETEWKETQAAPEMAAQDGGVDDVIDPAQLRQRICAAVYMLMMKSEGTPARRHCNLPL